jgi:putative sigma-54 modulation protein
MQISVTFRHIEPSAPLRVYAEDKLSRIKKFLEEPIEAHVVLKVEKFRHIAEVTIDAPSLHVKGLEETEDMYSSIDLLMDNLESQVKKGKDKSRRRAPASKDGGLSEITHAEPFEEEEFEQRIIRTEQVYAKPMDLDEAVMQMNLTSREFMVFTNRADSRINVLYRRKDGHLGLIETVA